MDWLEWRLDAHIAKNAEEGEQTYLRASERGRAIELPVGEKEQRKMLTSAEMLHEALQNSSMCVLKGYGHGDCSLNHPDEYINQMNSLL